MLIHGYLIEAGEDIIPKVIDDAEPLLTRADANEIMRKWGQPLLLSANGKSKISIPPTSVYAAVDSLGMNPVAAMALGQHACGLHQLGM